MLSSCFTCTYSVVLIVVYALAISTAQYLTECDRGVKRPHPLQENAFQMYVLSEHESKWIDRYCPAPKVFMAQECACGTPTASGTSLEAEKEQTTITTASPTTATSAATISADQTLTTLRRKPWFHKAKPWQKVQQKVQPQQRQQKQQQQQQDGQGDKPTKEQALQWDPQLTSQEMTSAWDNEDVAPVREALECIHHRPREGSPGQYEQWTEGGWLVMDCNWPVNSGLVWTQELCRCEWGPDPIVRQSDLSGVPAVCLMMLKMTFENGEIKDVGRGLWLDLRHPYNMEALRDDSAVGGWAGAFRGSGLSVPFFKMNTLGSTFRIKFRFQLCDGQPDTDLLLLNNGCVESDHLPSLQVSYRAWTNVLAFQMATVNSAGPFREECHIHSKDPWTDVNIHYDKDLLDIFVNGQHCIRSTAFSGPIVQTDCPFTLLEDNFCGLLDEVVITRGCTPEQES